MSSWGRSHRGNGKRGEQRPQASNAAMGIWQSDFKNNAWGMAGSSKGWWESADRWRDEAGETRWWESADGWRDEAGETEWCEGEALITRGGGDHAASERNEFDAVKTEVKNMKEDIKVILQGFEKTMKVMAENLHLAKEEICGAKARIEMLEADSKKVVQTDDRGIAAVVTAPPQHAPQSPVVTASESAPVVRAPHSPALTAPQSESNDEPCRWHKHVPDSWVEPDYTGVVEKHTDDWITHLSSTLFAKNTRTCYKIGSRIKAVGGSKCRVTACRTQANRFFHVQCLKCLQCVYGAYGTWTEDASPMAPKRAMSLLAEFFMVEEGGEKPQT